MFDGRLTEHQRALQGKKYQLYHKKLLINIEKQVLITCTRFLTTYELVSRIVFVKYKYIHV